MAQLQKEWMLLNFSSNNSQNSSSPLARALSEQVIGTIVLLTIIIMTTVGNILVILAIFTYRPLTKIQNFFLVSLACTDLAVAVSVMPFHVVKFITGRWVFGLVVCQLWLTSDVMTCTASILHLCAIAMDRYWAIHDPIQYANRRTKRFVLFIILVIWVLSALVSIPPLLGWNDWSKRGLAESCEYTTDAGFVVYSACGSFFIPLLVMSIVYVKIFKAAKERINKQSTVRKGLQLIQGTIKNTATAPIGSPTEREPLEKRDSGVALSYHTMDGESLEAGERLQSPRRFKFKPRSWTSSSARPATAKPPTFFLRRQITQSFTKHKPVVPPAKLANGVETYFLEREKISIAKEKRAAKTLAVIMGVFVLCWLPFFLLYISDPFLPRGLIHPKIFEAANWLGYINSCLNPIIYTIFNIDFRKAFKRILFSRR